MHRGKWKEQSKKILEQDADQIFHQTASVSSGKEHQEPETQARLGISQKFILVLMRNCLGNHSVEKFKCLLGVCKGHCKMQFGSWLVNHMSNLGLHFRVLKGHLQYPDNYKQSPKWLVQAASCSVLLRSTVLGYSPHYSEGPKVQRL